MCRFDDGDSEPEWLSETRPVARKPHRCGECGRVIQAGEHYERSTGVWDRKEGITTYRTCAHCLVARGWLQIECGGWLFGEVHEDLREHFHGGGMEDRYRLGRLVVGMQKRWQGKRGLMPVPA